jgi:hypothetical protein
MWFARHFGNKMADEVIGDRWKDNIEKDPSNRNEGVLLSEEGFATSSEIGRSHTQYLESDNLNFAQKTVNPISRHPLSFCNRVPQLRTMPRVLIRPFDNTEETGQGSNELEVWRKVFEG